MFFYVSADGRASKLVYQRKEKELLLGNLGRFIIWKQLLNPGEIVRNQ